MKIQNKKTNAKVGRPSIRSCTFRRSDKHITFSAKTAKDIGLQIGCKVLFATVGKDLFLFPNTKTGFSVFAYKNGQKHYSFGCTAKNIVIPLLDSVNAIKVATFAISANTTNINGKDAYKVICTPLRVD